MTQDLVIQQRGDLHTMRPKELVATATEIADVLSAIIEKQKLYVRIGPGKHVTVEGWTTLLAMLGIVPRERDVQYADGEYTAYVDLVSLKTGTVVGGGSAMCGASDPTWAKRPLNAQRSMSITRAVGKGSRIGFSWIMKLAGYEATPAEEMDHLPTNTEAFKQSDAKPQPSGFDPKEATHVQWLKLALQKEGLSDSFDAIAHELVGKPRTAVGEIIAKVRKTSADIEAAFSPH